MATTNHVGFPIRGSTGLPVELGRVLSLTLRRVFGRRRPDMAPSNDRFAGPTLLQLSPNLRAEGARR